MTIKKTLTAALAVAAVAAPAASAQPADSGPLPGAHHIPQATQDLRSPDAREQWHQPADAVVLTVDKRSPDAVDFATRPPSEVTVVEVPSQARADSGFDWENAGTGAGVAFALSLIALGGFAAMGKRRSVTA
jgi:hypothetical protein